MSSLLQGAGWSPLGQKDTEVMRTLRSGRVALPATIPGGISLTPVPALTQTSLGEPLGSLHITVFLFHF